MATELVLDVNALVKYFYRRKGFILASAIFLAVVVGFMSVSKEQRFESDASVAIDLRNRNPVELSVTVAEVQAVANGPGLRHTAWCNFKERHGVVFIKCTSRSATGARDAVLVAIDQLVETFDQNIPEWGGAMLELEEIKKSYKDLGQKLDGIYATLITNPDFLENKNSLEMSATTFLQAAQFNLNQRIIALQETIDRLALYKTRVIAHPNLPSSPVAPKTMRNVSLAFVAGFLIALVLLAAKYLSTNSRR